MPINIKPPLDRPKHEDFCNEVRGLNSYCEKFDTNECLQICSFYKMKVKRPEISKICYILKKRISDLNKPL